MRAGEVFCGLHVTHVRKCTRPSPARTASDGGSWAGPGNEARVGLETELVHIGSCTIVLCFVGLTYGGIEILLTVFQMDCADLLQVNTQIEMNLA